VKQFKPVSFAQSQNSEVDEMEEEDLEEKSE